jgi:hypothetical protein
MSAQPAPAPADRPCRPLWLPDLQALTEPDITWLWAGYLAPGNLTLLTSPWKSGKTTLVSALLGHLKTGGTLAGRSVRPGKAVVVSEETPAQWRLRSARFDFAAHVCFLCRPFPGPPSTDDWLGLIDQLLGLHREFGLALVIIDSLGEFLPGGSENDARIMRSALAPLKRLTSAGLAVLLLHHPRKQAAGDGQWARGSGVLSAHVDILLEMQYFSAASAADRRRKLLAYSRSDDTPRRLVIELNEAGTDYASLGDLEEEEFGRGWQLLAGVLQDAEQKLTRAEILANWPADAIAPATNTLWRWLERALARGLIHRDGTGKKHDPFRYWLTGQDAHWDTETQARKRACFERYAQILGEQWVKENLDQLFEDEERKTKKPAEDVDR